MVYESITADIYGKEIDKVYSKLIKIHSALVNGSSVLLSL